MTAHLFCVTQYFLGKIGLLLRNHILMSLIFPVQAKTREAKLGCVFTQTGVDDKGRPVRDDMSTSYTGSIETAEIFG